MKFYLSLLLLVSVPCWLCAQSPAAPQLPQGPLLNRLEAPAAWTITAQASDNPPAAATGTDNSAPPVKNATPRITSVVKGQNLVFEKVLTENGTSIETWRVGDVAIMSQNKSGWFITPGGGNTFNTTDYSKADFAGFDWISLANFSGPRDVAGKHCITFKSQVVTLDPLVLATMESDYKNKLVAKYMADQRAGKTPDTSSRAFNANAFKVDVEADIDNETRLPVQLIYKDQDGKTITRSYIFQPAPAQLSMPPEVENVLKGYQNHVRRVMAGPAPI
jgi:hypothetical protein